MKTCFFVSLSQDKYMILLLHKQPHVYTNIIVGLQPNDNIWFVSLYVLKLNIIKSIYMAESGTKNHIYLNMAEVM